MVHYYDVLAQIVVKKTTGKDKHTKVLFITTAPSNSTNVTKIWHFSITVLRLSPVGGRNMFPYF